jgi:hypothetical protein
MRQEVTIMLAQQTSPAPRVVDRPQERMAVVEAVGDADVVRARAVGSLYGAITQLGLRSGRLRARRPNASNRPRDEWIVRWALPVPDDAPDLGCGIAIETWYGGRVAEIEHQGSSDALRTRALKRLHRLIRDCGYEPAGPLEEEYLTQPAQEPQRTVLRYELRLR